MKIKLGQIGRTHGLKGCMNIELYHSYSLEIMQKNSQVIINEELFFVEEVFAIVKQKAKMKLKNVDSVEKAKEFVTLFFYGIVEDSKFYLASIIGKKVKQGGKIIGTVVDVFDSPAGELFALNNNLIFSKISIKDVAEFVEVADNV